LWFGLSWRWRIEFDGRGGAEGFGGDEGSEHVMDEVANCILALAREGLRWRFQLRDIVGGGMPCEPGEAAFVSGERSFRRGEAGEVGWVDVDRLIGGGCKWAGRNMEERGIYERLSLLRSS
jgi:hypothetical protein